MEYWIIKQIGSHASDKETALANANYVCAMPDMRPNNKLGHGGGRCSGCDWGAL